MDFETTFHALTGNAPFPWQTRLYEHFIAGEWTKCKTCSLPTGLGKTAVIPIWLIALAEQLASIPRRLVYVVNRRTVVDQTTDEVAKFLEQLKSPTGKELVELHKALSKLCATQVDANTPPLVVSTLRGQLADNRQWSADPARPAVICGTVDMIGSRLLFAGYGIGFKQRPLHAAFLAQDTLIVHDEAHLEEPFQRLITRIEQEQEQFKGIAVAPKLRVLALTATPRGATDVFHIQDDDRRDDTVTARLEAVKQLSLLPVAKESDVPTRIVERALAFQNSNRAVLIFVRTIEHVKKVVDGLGKKKVSVKNIEQLTGTLRGRERDNLVETSVFKRFLPKPPADAMDGTVYLVCTSAGEVGVNISADDLVSDLSTFESMAQRFGRINRFGQCDDSTVTVVHPADFDDKKQIEIRRKKTLALLEQLTSVNPNALDTLHPDKSKPDPREAAFAPSPTMLELTDVLLDAWSLTSIRSRMPGRPDVEPYLHGVSEYEEPETHVAWREEVGEIKPDMFDDYPPQDLLELYPLKPHELLRDQSKRVFKELQSLAEHFGDRRVWLVDDYGVVDVAHTLASLTARDESPIRGKTVLLPHGVGGLNEHGMLDGNSPVPANDSTDPQRNGNDVADVLKEEGSLIRVRDNSSATDTSRGMRLILTIKWPENEDSETAEDPRTWFWFEKPAVTENSRNSVEPVLLDDHTIDVENGVDAILKCLSLEPWIADALRLAAKWHDLGKCRERWQGGIGRPEKWKDKWFAKSGRDRRDWKPRREGAYRHEFGSLLDVTQLDEFKKLDERTKDLVLHLIAAHHGMGRPHFEESQTIDPNHAGVLSSAMSIETIRRFARLQRTFGHWGLAYLESILRAADWQASAQPSKCFEEVVL